MSVNTGQVCHKQSRIWLIVQTLITQFTDDIGKASQRCSLTKAYTRTLRHLHLYPPELVMIPSQGPVISDGTAPPSLQVILERNVDSGCEVVDRAYFNREAGEPIGAQRLQGVHRMRADVGRPRLHTDACSERRPEGVHASHSIRQVGD